MTDKFVLIDAGHGGLNKAGRFDYGACHMNPGGTAIREADKALAISYVVYEFMNYMGIQARMFRHRGDHPKLCTNARRLAYARDNADWISAWVSIHLNSHKSPNAHGAEIFHWHKADAEELQIAEYIRNEYVLLTDIDGIPMFKWRGIKTVTSHDRWGDMARAYHKAGVPAVLVETGFLSNKRDRYYLTNPTYIQAIGEAIGLGIAKYVKSKEKP